LLTLHGNPNCLRDLVADSRDHLVANSGRDGLADDAADAPVNRGTDRQGRPVTRLLYLLDVASFRWTNLNRLGSENGLTM